MFMRKSFKVFQITSGKEEFHAIFFSFKADLENKLQNPNVNCWKLKYKDWIFYFEIMIYLW